MSRQNFSIANLYFMDYLKVYRPLFQVTVNIGIESKVRVRRDIIVRNVKRGSSRVRNPIPSSSPIQILFKN